MEYEDGFSDSSVEVVEENSVKLPEKSVKKYELAYKIFTEWQSVNEKRSALSEKVLMEYFEELAEKVKPNTLWSNYSMLRSTLLLRHSTNIARYTKLKALLKTKAFGYKPKKSKPLTSEEINRFLETAPDEKYLLTKVALIIGISGPCRKHELCQIKIDDIHDLGSGVLITINDVKTRIPRAFMITGRLYEIYKKYALLRPPYIEERRFFLNYQNLKCTKQPVGVNKFGNIPKQVARFLNLKNTEHYTGNCYIRTSARILAAAGEDITGLKRYGGCKSTIVAEYINRSMTNMIKVEKTE